MKKCALAILLSFFTQLGIANSVEWNCLRLGQSGLTDEGITYELGLPISLMSSSGFEAYVLLELSFSGAYFSISTVDLEHTLSGFVGNWLVANPGDVSCEATTRNQGRYLNHAKIDGESGYSTYGIQGVAPNEYYLMFAVENLDDYKNNAIDPRYAYGWAHIAINGDMDLLLLESAISYEGSPIVVGPTPEPSSLQLLLVGLACFSLRRRRMRQSPVKTSVKDQ